ncbi:MAG: hypothetical protein NTY12_01355 [Candidatus Falkowbacteria bacterium]|nr:hypothetical protein [Candidatus Falkowbacteria bacterium]
MNLENPSFSSGRVRDRLDSQSNSIADAAIGSVFNDSDDLRKALAEVFED